jgi:hypothetical protein
MLDYENRNIFDFPAGNKVQKFEILSCHMGFCELFELFSVMKTELLPNQNFCLD